MSRYLVIGTPIIAAAIIVGVLVSDLTGARSTRPSEQTVSDRWEYRIVPDNLFLGGGRGDVLNAAEYQRTAEYRNANPVRDPKTFNDYTALLERGLNTLGNDGWELCHVNEREDRYTFRRPAR